MAKKIQLSYKEIEDRLRVLKDKSFAPEEIGFRLLYAFGKGVRDIERMKEGKGIISTFDGLLIKKEFCYKSASTLELVSVLEDLKRDTNVQKAEPKIIAVCDAKTIRAFDTRQRETFEQQVDRLYCDFEFFYPLAGVERIEYIEESPADIKAAEKLAKLHDEIRAYNEFTSDSDLHDLNTFIARLLFCFFAEDTGIFAENVFTNAIKTFTVDARNLKEVLEQIFRYMGNKPIPAGMLQTYCKQKFSYVGGGLFERQIYIPELSNKARQIIIESGELDWQSINPDIFGSMIQAVVNPDERATQGMHYTSVPNIMKVIQPLFLDELTAEKNKLAAKLDEEKKLLELTSKNSKDLKIFYEKGQYIKRSCRNLLRRMAAMKFFDPACGSGNFLIITYKQLRLLELDILAIIRDCQPEGLLDMDILQGTVIKLSQFYGIELLDFPHEIAMLSLWLAEHQMNRKLYKDFGVVTDALPLKDITQIRCGNACRIDWNEVCHHTADEEVFIFGNPPYLGSSKLDQSQQVDRELVLGHLKSFKKIDYIGIWFYNGAKYIKGTKSKYAFVSTNSICQGEIVEPLWTSLFNQGLIINFAYTSFKWRNNAKNNAGVTCIIVGFVNKNNQIIHPVIYSNNEEREVKTINAYLLPTNNIIVGRHNDSISKFKPISMGCKPVDGGNLIMDKDETQRMLRSFPESKKWIKELYSADDYINGKTRFCLWIPDQELETAKKILEIANRINKTAEFRLKSKDEGARKMAETSHQFREFRSCKDDTLVIPSTSSENRKYIPMGFANSNMVVNNAMYMVFEATTTLFGVVTSYMSMMWMKTIGGKLETRYRYTNMCYNSFPFPKISDEKKAEIEKAAEEVLIVRQPYLTMGKTLADLYDPDTMPEDLKSAHERLDDIVESCYPGYPFATDEARLECLFKMYEKMTAKKQ